MTVQRDEAIAAIAARVLRVGTLEERRSDSLDFHDLGVTSIKEALEAAYAAGETAARAQLAPVKEQAAELLAGLEGTLEGLPDGLFCDQASGGGGLRIFYKGGGASDSAGELPEGMLDALVWLSRNQAEVVEVLQAVSGSETPAR